MKVTNIVHVNLTDEEIYQKLRREEDDNFMTAKEWKKLRLKQLKKEGKQWSS